MTISRISCRMWAGVILVLFAAAGAAVVGDYGVAVDPHGQRRTAAANLEYVLGDDDALSLHGLPDHNRYYGMAFQAPLLLAERALGLDDSRTAYLFRHSVIHLFWLCGGFACFLLARRLFGGGPPALAAMLLFLLHPRLYAHSFFNGKDVPFLSMFMIALHLVHRAFEKDTARAFAVLGMGTAVLTNLRIMGVMLFAAVLGMRALDLLHAAQRSGRRRVLKTTAAFGAAWAATLYAISPYLWSDPREFAEALRVLSEHPNYAREIFQGRLVHSHDLPWQYVPTWVAITTPPFTLLLGGVGVVGIAWRGAARPGRALRNTPLRFGLLLTACLTAPPLAVAALGANTYGGGRHLYFLHAPLALLAASGLRLLASRDAAWVRRGAYAATGVAAAGILIAMARMHPLQHVYFNFLVDRTTPEHLRTQYEMDYWGTADLGALNHLALTYSSIQLCVTARGGEHGHLLLSEAQRMRIIRSRRTETCRGRSDFVFDAAEIPYAGIGTGPPETHAPTAWTQEVYGNTIAKLYGLNPALLDNFHVDRFREKYRSLSQGAPAVRARYDLYFDAARRALTYARAPCARADTLRFFLHVVPADAEDLPDHRVQYGFDNLDFNLRELTLFDGKCLVTVRLPEYAVARVRTGQFRSRRQRREGASRYENVWAVSFSPGDLDGAVGGEPPLASPRRSATSATSSGRRSAPSWSSPTRASIGRGQRRGDDLLVVAGVDPPVGVGRM